MLVDRMFRAWGSSFLCASLLWGTAGIARAAQPPVTLGSVVRIAAPGDIIQSPLWTYSDPVDGRHLIACGSLSKPRSDAWSSFVYASSDSGATWQRPLLDDATLWVSEPSCVIGADGHAYFAAGESDTSTGEGRHEWGHMQLFTSADHGTSWSRAALRAEGFVDWTFLAAVPPSRGEDASVVIFGNHATDQPGHWSTGRPMVITATDMGRTLSPLVTTPKPSMGTFAGGSVVLPDRTALFISSTHHEGQAYTDAEMTVFAYSPATRTLQARTVLHTGQGHFFSTPSLVRHEGPGPFPGRLYAAWSEYKPYENATLWLATSDDDGFHWTTRSILATPRSHISACPNDLGASLRVSISVTRSGALGVLWLEDDRQVLFSASVDGGRTFGPREVVASHETGRLVAEDAIALNEWMLAQILGVRHAQPIAQYGDPGHRGLSVRLYRPAGVDSVSLTADAHNVLHAFWAGLDAEGNRTLLTRTVKVAATAPGVGDQLAPPSGAATCSEDTGPLHPAIPSDTLLPGNAIEAKDRESLYLRVERFDYDPASSLVTADVTLRNKSEYTLRAPVTLVGIGMHSDFGVPSAQNATGMRDGNPYWDASAFLPAAGLTPGSESAPISLRFRLEQTRKVPTGDAVALYIRLEHGPLH